MPRDRRLYVLGAGGSAPRSVIAHEVVHALQDEHFDLTRGPFAPRPAITTACSPRRRSSRATPPTCRRATSPRSRRSTSSASSERTLRSRPDADAAASPRSCSASSLFSVHGRPGVRARPAGTRRPAPARPRVPPPSAHDRGGARPGRYLAGDPPARAVGCPPPVPPRDDVRSRGSRCADRPGALARGWLGGRLGVGERGLDLRLATRAAASVKAALRRVLPPPRRSSPVDAWSAFAS